MINISEIADPWVVQASWMTPQEISDNLDAQVKAGTAQFFWSDDGSTAWFVKRCTNRVADVHLFSKSHRIVSNSRAIQRKIWENTIYQKLEMRTHICGVWSLARRLGWQMEGVRRGSIELQDGRIVDEHLYGVLR